VQNTIKIISRFVLSRQNFRHLTYLNYVSREKQEWTCDFGCGCKGALPNLSKFSELVVGFDANKQELVKAKTLQLANLNLVIGDCLHPPFRDGVFATMVCTHVLEHLIEPEKALDEIYRIIKNGASCFFEVPYIGELFDVSFSSLPLAQWARILILHQWCRALLLRALDDIQYKRKSALLPRFFFQKLSGQTKTAMLCP